jgi:hypothetical protein
MRKFYSFVFLLLLAGGAFAFTVTVPEETVIVPIGGEAEVGVKIYSQTSDSISLTVLENTPWITQSDTMIKLDAGETKTVVIYVSPFVGTVIGVHRITLLAESPTREQQKKTIFINVNKIELVDAEKVAVAGNLVPTGQVNVTATLKNYKEKTAESVKVTTTVKSPSSVLVQFEQIIGSIDAGETRNVSYSFTIPRNSEPGLYSINITTVSDGSAKSKIRTFSVSSISTFTKDVTKLPSFFGFRKMVTVTNTGNVAGDATVTDTVSSLDSSFYAGEPPASVRNGEIKWVVKNVAPGESRSFVYAVDYSPVALLLLALGIGAWVYMFKIRTVRVKKYIMEKKFIEEGEEFTVGIEVINTSGAKVEHVTAKDFVPSVFDIKEMDGPKPSRRKVATGTELIWNLKDLHNNEERLFSYKIIPMFGIHGQIRLPRASVHFKKGKNEVENKSFFAMIGIEMENYRDKAMKK